MMVRVHDILVRNKVENVIADGAYQNQELFYSLAKLGYYVVQFYKN